MPTIHLFDISSIDKTHFRTLIDELPAGSVALHDGPAAIEPDAEIISLFVNSRVTADMITAMPHLKLIACRSTGFDNVDMVAAKERGITVSTVPSYGDVTVAEYGFGLLLSLTRKIPVAVEQLSSGQISREASRGIDLMGKTLSLLGAGRIGCRMAAIARGFGMRVVAYDAYPNADRAKEFGFTYVSMDEALGGADVLSLHIPAMPETYHLMNATAFAKMKPSAIILNTARGDVIDTPALVEALKSGQLAGAALDVFEGEGDRTPAVADLQRLPNVIMTNHNAFNSLEAVERINHTTRENITGFLAGQPQNQARV